MGAVRHRHSSPRRLVAAIVRQRDDTRHVITRCDLPYDTPVPPEKAAPH